jgi:membrane protease YdiL (CAAX protease family)
MDNRITPTDSAEPLVSRPSIGPQVPFPVWSGWDILLLICFTSFAALVVGAFGGAASHFLQVKFPALKNLPHLANEGIFLLSFQAVLDALILMFIYFTITLKYNSPFLQSIKWVHPERSSFWRYSPLGVLLAFLVLGASSLLPNQNKPPIEELLKYPITAFFFAGLGILVAPFVEEVIFRGFIYPVVERRGGKMMAVGVTAMLFTAVHVSQLWGSWVGILLILLVGLTLSIVRARTDSLVPSFVIHLSYNSTIGLLFLAGSAIKAFQD